MAVGGDEVLKLTIKVFADLLAQHVYLDIAGFKDSQSILIIQQPDEQVLQGGKLMVAIIRLRKSPVQSPFKTG